MVEKVERIAGTTGSMATHTNHSVSITSEPDAVWVAYRQSAITLGLEKRGHGDRKHPDADEARGESDHHRDPLAAEARQSDGVDPKEERLSGESERIGSGNWDDDVPFGKHVGYL